MSFLLSVAALSLVYLVVARLERTRTLRFRVLPAPRPYLGTDLAWYGLAVAATAISVFAFRPVLAMLQIGPVRDAVTSVPVWLQLGIALVVFDYVSFLVHVGLHRSDTLWNLHKVHHSSLYLDGFATTRNHPVENLLRFVPGQAVLFLMGMGVGVVAPAVAIAAIYGVSNHSNLRVNPAWLEVVLVTPRIHRRHHVPETTHRNYGAIFTIWDRLFGTLLRRDTAPDERFGVPGEIDSYPQAFRSAAPYPLVQIRDRRAQRLAAASAGR
jgi:sterol desaturase/sphingolipid hydroxylase (fatty acid hydroxylase superfamily)